MPYIPLHTHAAYSSVKGDQDSTTTVCNPLTSFTLTASTYVYNFSFAPSSSFLFLDNRKRMRWGTVLIPLSQTFLFNWGSTRTSFVPYTLSVSGIKGQGLPYAIWRILWLLWLLEEHVFWNSRRRLSCACLDERLAESTWGEGYLRIV